jgi:phosphotransferase system enzyme I (PtsP)
MVTSINEVVKAKALITQAHKQLLAEGYPLKLPPLGAMLEVPVMIYQIPGLAQHIDFLCIGTNDLCQYLLAVDRNNPRVANSYSDYHPGILKALQQIAQISQQQNITLTICGELASDPCWALLLIAMGFNNLSMDHSRLLTIKKLIRSVKLTQAQQILNQAESLQDGNAIEGRLKQALNDLGLSDLLGPQFEV